MMLYDPTSLIRHLRFHQFFFLLLFFFNFFFCQGTTEINANSNQNRYELYQYMNFPDLKTENKKELHMYRILRNTIFSQTYANFDDFCTSKMKDTQLTYQTLRRE